jgi:SAM-dependent methyltransferase
MQKWQFISENNLGFNRGPGNSDDIFRILKHTNSIQPLRYQKVLDVGCNTAWLAHYFDDYYGFDINASGIHLARSFWLEKKKWSKEEITNRFLLLKEHENLPDDLIDFDGVFLKDVIEHVSDPVQFTRMLIKRLKTGGWIYISTPDNQRWVWNDPTHKRPFPLKSLKDLSEMIGAKVIYSGHESVMPGTQKVARLFNNRSPFFIRLFAKLYFWPRNSVVLLVKE